MVILAITGESLQEKVGQQVGRRSKTQNSNNWLSIFGFDFWVKWANQVSFVVYIFELVLITGTIRKPNYYRSTFLAFDGNYHLFCNVTFHIPAPRDLHFAMSGLPQSHCIMDPLSEEQEDIFCGTPADF